MPANMRVMIVAGGTGGHVFPALAVAQKLIAQGERVSWVGTKKGIESRVVPEQQIDIDYIRIQGLRGKGLLGWLSAPFRVVMAVSQALQICLKRRPDVVLGMGGFVTGPVGLAAWLLRRPLLIHEQNAIPGMTNKFLARIASQVMEAFPGSFEAKYRAIHTGNPVRQEITDVTSPAQRFSERGTNIRLLVIGGSLGAQALNESVPAALATLSLLNRPEVIHQAGRNKQATTANLYKTLNVDGEVKEFIDDMAAAYSWADLVICRAGAMTIAELAATGVASILVPYPYAVDDHQTYNAHYLSEQGAGILLQQSSLTKESLSEILGDIMSKGRENLLAMAEKARSLAKPNATESVVNICKELAYG